MAALEEVHRADAYPMLWPADPARWLCDSDLLAAWVAEVPGGPGGAAGPTRIVGHVTLVRAAGSRAAGLWAGRTGREEHRAGAVGRLFVAPAARGHGLGARLLGTAVAQARRWGLHPVLDVAAGSTAAVALYERLGWRRLETVQESWVPGETVDVHCYTGPGAHPVAAAGGRPAATVRTSDDHDS
ncbi:GNAT family N-acetyltransferase [Kitasatospora sp. NPDC052896]|uniref:GNAT family N-acetyltransferase n=1 Tax=Kitasatospora sp. NPDC052896 TaxID=3364061 RepID=UPI0037C5AAE7